MRLLRRPNGPRSLVYTSFATLARLLPKIYAVVSLGPDFSILSRYGMCMSCLACMDSACEREGSYPTATERLNYMSIGGPDVLFSSPIRCSEPLGGAVVSQGTCTYSIARPGVLSDIMSQTGRTSTC
jgi:hypothetical protein